MAVDNVLQVLGIGSGGAFSRFMDFVLHGQWQFEVPPVASVQLQTAATLVPNVHIGACYILSRSGVITVTMGAPTAGTDDGRIFEFQSDSANAHVINFTGNTLDSGGPSVASATFNANKGATLRIRAYNGRWKVVFANGVSFS